MSVFGRRVARRNIEPPPFVAERGTDQGEGKYTRPAPTVRRARRRRANAAAKLARKANR